MILIKFALIVVVIFIAMYIAKAIIRKVFHIEKPNQESSYEYVNPLHKQVNRTYRNFAVVILFLILIVNVVYFDESYYLFIGAMFISTLIQMAIRAFFEWKHSNYPKQSILTLTEMFVFIVAVVIILQFNLL